MAKVQVLTGEDVYNFLKGLSEADRKDLAISFCIDSNTAAHKAIIMEQSKDFLTFHSKA